MVSAKPEAPLAIDRDAHRSVTLSGVSWAVYEQLLDELERAGRRVTLTYDGGELEVEMPSEIHELIKAFVRVLVEQYCIETGRPYLPVGQTTYRRRVLAKGIEPDESYYLTNLGRISQRGDNNLELIPPPDLAIEVEVTGPLLDKLPVYAAIGIPELWHVTDAGRVRILQLNGVKYEAVSRSREIPYFTATLLEEWMARRLAGEHFAVMQEFRSSLQRG